MRHDKKRHEGRLHFVLLEAPGRPVVTDDVDTNDVLHVLGTLNP
jgi:3-dehydroquinate synthetase